MSKTKTSNTIKMIIPSGGNHVRSAEIRVAPAGFWINDFSIKIKNLTNPQKTFSVFSITFNPNVENELQIGVHAQCDLPGVEDKVWLSYSFNKKSKSR